jgi:hypothetical protein
MADEASPVAIEASAVLRTRPGRGYPEPFASRVARDGCGGRSAITSA